MNRIVRLAVSCLMLASGAIGATEVFASDRHRGPDRGSEQAYADRTISLDEAVARAERQYRARAVRAEEKHHGDRIEYRIRLLGEDGRVFEVRVDAASGRED